MSDVKIREIHKYDDIINKFKEDKPISIYCEEIITQMHNYKKLVMQYQNYKISYMLNEYELKNTKLDIKEIIEYILNYMWERMKKELHL